VAFLPILVIAAGGPSATGDIYRWDNGRLIPGTEGITPGPHVDLSDWNNVLHNLLYADLTGDLSDANFSDSWLGNARFADANLTRANLTNAQVNEAIWTNANLTDAVVAGANFGYGTSRGFTQAQLTSTASYKAKNLQGIHLYRNDLTAWNFGGQDLSGAVFTSSLLTNAATLTDADLTGTIIIGATFESTTSRFHARPTRDNRKLSVKESAASQLFPQRSGRVGLE
jgi:hypothetical protein